MTPTDRHSVRVHILDPGSMLRAAIVLPGATTASYITKSMAMDNVPNWKQLFDEETQALYAITAKEGSPTVTLPVRKQLWDFMRERLAIAGQTAPDTCEERAKRLVSAADWLTSGSRQVFQRSYPSLSEVNPEHWEVLLTVASAASTFADLQLKVPKHLNESIRQITSYSLQRWHTQGVELATNCQDYLRLGSESEVESTIYELLGWWVLQMLHGQDCSGEQLRPAGEIGTFVIIPFRKWWDIEKSQLVEFLNSGGDRPYRELIEYHVRKQPVEDLQASVLGEIARIPDPLQPMAMEFIDVTNGQFAYDRQFWEVASCRAAFEAITETAIEFFPLNDWMVCKEHALEPSNHDLAFGIFQIPTLSFAYSASLQPKQRKLMGIRKGVFR